MIKAGREAFGRHSTIMKGTKVFNQCILPAMTFGVETWTLTIWNMERNMPHITYKDLVKKL